MTPWLALSLGFWLGQTPEVTPALPPDADVQDPAALQMRDAWERALLNADATDEGQDFTDGNVQMPVLEVGASGVGGASTAGTTEAPQSPQAPQAPSSSESPAPSTGNPQQDIAQLRNQLESLQAQQEESTAQTELLQQRLTGMQERAQELERMRQQRLVELERASSWLAAADQALVAGELAVSDALGEADSALAQVVASASSAGGGQTVVLVEDARDLIAQALESTGRRDAFLARCYLLDAEWRLREARRRNLDAPSATVITQ